MRYVILGGVYKGVLIDLLQSLKVKIEYINHLRKEGLIVDHFLPQIFNILGLYEGTSRAFKLDIWTIDEYYLDREFRACLGECQNLADNT